MDIIIELTGSCPKMLFFSDLGLIVIDEEQRFGVKHKETLKELKKKGGCAYLDSPIPRTLHMSMLEFEICLSSKHLRPIGILCKLLY